MSLSRWSSDTLIESGDSATSRESSVTSKKPAAHAPPAEQQRDRSAPTGRFTLGSRFHRHPSAAPPIHTPQPFPPRRLCDSSSISERTYNKIFNVLSEYNCNWHDLYYCLWRAGIVRIDTFDISTYCHQSLQCADFDLKTSRGTSSGRTARDLEKAWIKVQLILLGRASFEALLCYLWEQGYRPWLTPPYKAARPSNPRNTRDGPHCLLTFPFAGEQPPISSIPDIQFPRIKFVPKADKEAIDKEADAKWNAKQAEGPKRPSISSFSRLPSYTDSVTSFTRPGSDQPQAAKRPISTRSNDSVPASLVALHSRNGSQLSSHYNFEDLPIFTAGKGQPVSTKTKRRHRLARRFKKGKKKPKEKPGALPREARAKVMKEHPVYQAVKTKKGWF